MKGIYLDSLTGSRGLMSDHGVRLVFAPSAQEIKVGLADRTHRITEQRNLTIDIGRERFRVVHSPSIDFFHVLHGYKNFSSPSSPLDRVERLHLPSRGPELPLPILQIAQEVPLG